MQSKHFRTQVIAAGQWTRLSGTHSGDARTHAIPTDDIGRTFVQALVDGHQQPGATPGWAVVDGARVGAIRLFTDHEDTDPHLVDALRLFDGWAEDYFHSSPTPPPDAPTGS